MTSRRTVGKYIPRADPGVTNETVSRASRTGIPNSSSSAFKGSDYGEAIQFYKAPIRFERIWWLASAVLLLIALVVWLAA